MERKAMFEPGDVIKTFTGVVGMVISGETFDKIKDQVKEGKKPGYFFCVGCAEKFDYVIHVPVFFEDGTYDIMKTMNVKKIKEGGEEKKSKIEEIIANI